MSKTLSSSVAAALQLQKSLCAGASSALRPVEVAASSSLAACFSSAPSASSGSDSKEVGKVLERNVSGTPAEREPTTVAGVSFPNDIRGTSALGIGDGLTTHTDKWKSLAGPSPMDYVNQMVPIKVYKNVIACSGDAIPSLGHPIQYIRLDGSSLENPVTCKYCSFKFYYAGH